MLSSNVQPCAVIAARLCCVDSKRSATAKRKHTTTGNAIISTIVAITLSVVGQREHCHFVRFCITS